MAAAHARRSLAGALEGQSTKVKNPVASGSQELSGSCACGRVGYRAISGASAIIHCHCSDCRKRHGSAFATHVGVPREQFTVVQGRDAVEMYRTNSGTRRWFCKLCGSKLVSEADGWDEVYVTAGTLDGPIEIASQIHIFVRSKVSWYDIPSEHVQYFTHPVDWLEQR